MFGYAEKVIKKIENYLIQEYGSEYLMMPQRDKENLILYTFYEITEKQKEERL